MPEDKFRGAHRFDGAAPPNTRSRVTALARRPWTVLPASVQRVAVTSWSALPDPVRLAVASPLTPLLERWTGGHTVTPGPPAPGPQTVPGVAELVEQGWTPLEEQTGFTKLWRAWPPSLRTSVTETREAWLDEHSRSETDGAVWLVRSPWPSLDAGQAVAVLWRLLEDLNPPPVAPDDVLDHARILLAAPETVRHRELA